LPRARVAADLGVGKSTLGKWLADYRPAELVSAPQADLALENERLRLENRILKEERDILDLHSRRVVGWAVSDRMKKDLAIRALEMAVNLRQPAEGCIFHSDRGSQYCAYDYQKKLQAYGLRPSMSGKGNCYDNASVETFFKSLKAELIWRQKWSTRRQAEAAIFQYVNGFYNTRRRHSYLGGISPLAFEAKVA
jgi:putative transposase